MPDERKVGPFTGRQWLLGAGGGVAAWLVYRWYRGRQAGAAASATPGAGGTIPPGGAVSSSSPLPTTLAQWQQDALNFGTDPIATLNAVTNWLAGNCVDPSGYGGVKAAIEQLGLPPGMTNYPVLTVCAAGNPTSSPSGGGAGGTGSSGSAGGGSGGGATPVSSAGGGNAASNPNAPNLASLLSGVWYAPPAYPGAPQVGFFQVPNFPSGAANPYGVPTPGPGGIVELVGNTAVGSEPYWQVANNQAIAAGQPIPYPHGA